MPFCNQHLEMLTQLTEVSTSLKGLVTQMTDTNNFRRGIVLSMVGIIFTVFLHVGASCYFLGQITRQVTVNTARLNILEETARELIKNGAIK